MAAQVLQYLVATGFAKNQGSNPLGLFGHFTTGVCKPPLFCLYLCFFLF
ncbi:hypothetical protein M23134_03531 [Microscilla marina ATCC 23134]|uniref:Uncharacterized protein n=1 Tax=Microscilla marina ATCC 23134 TaxID=313606 RepID=A1ZN89_MICM2|nr:hypothetical protein M23134_03531 [Microscilla marina ATCC 23134]